MSKLLTTPSAIQSMSIVLGTVIVDAALFGEAAVVAMGSCSSDDAFTDWYTLIKPGNDESAELSLVFDNSLKM